MLAWLAIAGVISIASFPAWTGQWIGDDWFMRESSNMDDLGDLLAVFGRTSADYLDSSSVGPSTYRPLSMATLILGRLVSDDPLPHHLFSLVLHLICVATLGVIAYRLRGPVVAAWVAVIFGLHPLGIEAYGWINGRSDPLSCLGVATVAYALLCPLSALPRFFLSVVGAAVAVMSKEVGTIALAGIALAALIPVDATNARIARVRREAILPALGCGLVVAAFLVTRVVVAHGDSAGPTSLFDAPGSGTALIRLFAAAAQSVLVPLPRTMACLGYTLGQPTDPIAWAPLLLCALVTLLFLRNLRSLTILAFAALCVVPCVMLRHAFWVGLDRYLYVPLFMVCLAFIVAPPSFRDRTPLEPSGWLRIHAVLVTLAVSTWLTAGTYRDTAKHMAAMIDLRPDEPTGYLLGAKWLWHATQHAEANALIDRIPQTGLPAPLASALATQLASMGRQREALAVVDDMTRRFPDDPYVLSDTVAVGIERRGFDIVFDALDRLRRYPRFCRAARDTLTSAKKQPLTTTDAQRIDHFLSHHRCQ